MSEEILRGAATLKLCDLSHGFRDNPATAYGHRGSVRICIRLRESGVWIYDPAWETSQ